MPARVYFTCTLPDCDRPHKSRGLCRMHYLRQYRHGSTEARLRPKRICSEGGCGQPARGRGLCHGHYSRWYTGSDKTGVVQPVIGTPPLSAPPKNLTREQWLVYAAGFFDGEGCISIIHIKPTRYYLTVQAAQCDTRPLMILQSLFGGSVKIMTKGGVNRPVHSWAATCRQAAAALREMRPYLVVKKDQALCAIRFQRTVKLGQRNTPQKLAIRERLCLRLASLKHTSFLL